MTAQNGRRGTVSPIFLNFGARWPVGGQHHAPAALSPGQSPGSRCTGGWVGPRASLDRFWKKKSLTLTGFRSRKHTARSDSLSRLSNRGSTTKKPITLPRPSNYFLCIPFVSEDVPSRKTTLNVYSLHCFGGIWRFEDCTKNSICAPCKMDVILRPLKYKLNSFCTY